MITDPTEPTKEWIDSIRIAFQNKNASDLKNITEATELIREAMK